MRSFYNVDGIKVMSEVAPNKQELIVKVQLPEMVIDFQKTERRLLFDLMPKKVVQAIEQIITLDTNLFIRKTPSVN